MGRSVEPEMMLLASAVPTRARMHTDSPGEERTSWERFNTVRAALESSFKYTTLTGSTGHAARSE